MNKVMERRRIAIIAGAALLCAGMLVLWLFDPQSSAWMPRCWWHSLTGLQCPACGTMRAVHACLHGDFAAALRYNYMLPVYLPLAAAVVALLAWRPRSRMIAPLSVALALLLIAWMIARNLIGV